MASKMPSNASLWPASIAEDEAVVVEVVAGVHADAGRELAAHGDFEICVEQGDLDAVDLWRRWRG